MNKPFAENHCQRGIVLISAIVMLVMMSLIAISMIRLGTRHTQVVNNEQLRMEGEAAANYALDLMLNDSANTWTAYKGAGKAEQVNIGLSDMSATSSAAIAVTLQELTCKRIRILQNQEFVKAKGGINYVAEGDASCFGSDPTQLTIVDSSASSSSAGESLCASALYEVQARTTDPRLLGANVEVTQGVEVRRSVLDLGTCD